MIKKVLSRNWDYTVYQKDEAKIISVVFFGRVDFFRSFMLLSHEMDADMEYFTQLAEKIRNNYATFKDREIVPPITKETKGKQDG